MLKKGVYTSQCPNCSRSILIHLLSDGSISPNKCSKCEAEFEGIDKGEERNTFVIIPSKAKKLNIFVDKEAEEKPKERKVPVKTHKESFKIWKDGKDR
jgi:DNA-directed RNA polymerase subunit RPC12/RpoP